MQLILTRKTIAIRKSPTDHNNENDNEEALRDLDGEIQEAQSHVMEQLKPSSRNAVEGVKKHMLALFSSLPNSHAKKAAKKKLKEQSAEEPEQEVPQQARSAVIDHDHAAPSMGGQPVIPGAPSAPATPPGGKRKRKSRGR